MIIGQTMVGKKFQNGEKVHHTWMCFSPLFCSCCTSFNGQFTELRNKCTNLALQYSKDLNVLEVYHDYKDIIISLKKAKQNGKKLDFPPKGLLKYISSMGLEAYGTLAITLQILMTLPVSVASFERSFSKMKLIKSCVQSTMSQDKFTNLAILSVENEVASSIDFGDVIKDFAAIKSRKVQF
jgi:predicted transport protein